MDWALSKLRTSTWGFIEVMTWLCVTNQGSEFAVWFGVSPVVGQGVGAQSGSVDCGVQSMFPPMGVSGSTTRVHPGTANVAPKLATKVATERTTRAPLTAEPPARRRSR